MWHDFDNPLNSGGSGWIAFYQPANFCYKIGNNSDLMKGDICTNGNKPLILHRTRIGC